MTETDNKINKAIHAMYEHGVPRDEKLALYCTFDFFVNKVMTSSYARVSRDLATSPTARLIPRGAGRR